MKIVLYTEGLAFTGDTLEQQALGGSETAFISVAREFARKGHEVHAYCVCSKPGVYDGVTYHHAPEVREWETRECDLFLCSRFFPVFQLNLRARARYLWMHDVLAEPWTGGLRQYLHRIDAIYCLSRYHAAVIAQALPEARDRIRLTSNGIDSNLVATAIQGAAKKHRIMFTSRAERGLWNALDAYESLADPGLEFVYCSYSPLPDARVEALEKRCRDRMQSLTARGFPIRTGCWNKHDLYRTLAESKAVIYPTDFPEISCISAMEAQACGTVFLTVDDFALRETIGYERVPRGDAAAFATRLRDILADPTLRTQLEEAGRKHVRRFTWESVAQAFLAADTRVESLPHLHAAMPGGDEIFDQARLRIETDFRRRSEVRRRNALSARVNLAAQPKISCVTVTYGRIALLKQSIRSFCDQTYPNKELWIVTDGEVRYQGAIEDHLRSLDRDDIKLLLLNDRRYTLGAIRNVSLQAATGDLICQWDDDDCSHPERLATQAHYLLDQRADACFLTDHLQFFYKDRLLLWTDWSYGGSVQGKWQLAPGTILMRRDSRFRYPETGPSAQRGEDSALIDSFYERLKIARLGGAGYLYLYTYHGRNTFSEEHHRGLQNASAPVEFIRSHAAALRESLDYYALPRPLSIRGSGGQLYAVER